MHGCRRHCARSRCDTTARAVGRPQAPTRRGPGHRSEHRETPQPRPHHVGPNLAASQGRPERACSARRPRVPRTRPSIAVPRPVTLAGRRGRGRPTAGYADRRVDFDATASAARNLRAIQGQRSAEGEMSIATVEQTITEHEAAQIERANASSATPVVVVHGLWLLPSSWDNWVTLFEESGYVGLTPAWPDDPETVEEARKNPDVLAKKTLKQTADHTTEIVDALDRKPAVIGHSTGGLLAQMLAGRGLSAATVAIDPGVFRGVLPLPGSVLKGVGPFLVNPRTRGRAITLTFDQFKYGWTNALDEKEAKELYDTFHVAGSGISLVQMGNANLNPRTEAKVNTTNPDRGPLLIIDGEKDHTVPWAIAHAAYKRQKRNPGVTEIVKIPNRGHSLTIDHGWQEVAQTALDFVKRFSEQSDKAKGVGQ